MQLFRTQALEHQNRLHGEVFLVPPLRWQAIGWLLFIAVAAGLVVLSFGTFNRAVEARGVLAFTTSSPLSVTRSSYGRDWTAVLAIPASQIAAIRIGQKVSISLDGYPLRDFGTLDGEVVSIADKRANDADLHFDVRVALAAPTRQQRQSGLMLRNNWPVAGRIVINKQSILGWLIAPKPVGTAR